MSNEYIVKNKSEIIAHLENQGGKVSGKFINEIPCPKCKKPEAYTHLEDPSVIHCNRKNHCGESVHVKEIFPDLFQDFQKRFPATPEDSKATARAYLESRGLDPDQFNFEQGSKDNHSTVAIKVPWSDKRWHRLIDYKGGGNKNRWDAGGGYQGRAFTNGSLEGVEELWIVEGVFDCLSLEQIGIRAAATFSSQHVPEDLYEDLSKDVGVVVALDTDSAGRRGVFKNIEKLKELGFTNITVAQPPKGKDWNDLLVQNLLNEENLDETLRISKWRGKLLLASTIEEYRRVFEQERSSGDGFYQGLLEFQGATYYCTAKSGGKNQPPVPVTERILNAKIERAFTRINEEKRFNTEHKDFIKVTKAGSKQLRIIELAAGELVNGAKLKEVLKAKANVLLLDNSQTIVNAIVAKLERDKALNVRQVARLGYDEQSKCYTFKNFLYDENGERHQVNAEGFFEKQGLVCETDEDLIEQFEAVDLKTVIEIIRQVYGNRGLITLSFYVATLFKSDFLQRKGAFPYLSVSGLKGSGKTTLIDFCNHAFFQLWTGINASRSSTFKGLSRMLYHRHSLAIPYNESNGEVIGLDENQLLTGYHGGSLYVRAALSNDSSIINLPFNASLVFVQNIEPFSIGAVKERVISLRFQNAAEGGVTDESRAAMKELTALSAAQRAGIGHFILSNSKSIREQIFKHLDDTESDFATELQSPRVAFTHAVLMSTCQALLQAARFETKEIAKMELAEEILNLAKSKDSQSGGENDVANTFMENFEQLRTKGVYDSKDNFHQLVLGEHYLMNEEFYWIRLGEVERVMKEAGYLPLPKLSEKIKAADSLFVSEERPRGWNGNKAQRSLKLRRIRLEEITSEPEVN